MRLIVASSIVLALSAAAAVFVLVDSGPVEPAAAVDAAPMTVSSDPAPVPALEPPAPDAPARRAEDTEPEAPAVPAEDAPAEPELPPRNCALSKAASWCWTSRGSSTSSR